MNKWFNNFADKAASVAGRSYTFVFAVILITVWALTGPVMNFSDTWQLMINTFTTLVTFLMVFVIQNAQNKSDYSTQIKLDLIMRVLEVDDDDVQNIEDLTDKQLKELLTEVRAKHRNSRIV